MQINSKYHIPLLILLGMALYLPFIGSVHLFDWDEINFAECAREMIVTGDYLRVQIDFEDFHQKPPLFIWFQVLSMKLFGINEFAARFPNAIAGILNLLLLYLIGKEIRNRNFGLFWALAHGLSFLPFLYFKSGIIDPWFNLFIFSGIICYLFGLDKNRLIYFMLSGLSIGLAVLSKGPVALILFAAPLFIAVLSKRLWWAFHWKKLLSFALPFFLAGGSWFIVIALAGKAHIIYDFIDYQIRLFSTEDAGHGGPFYYHFLILLLACFPASIYALKTLVKPKEDFYETTIFWSFLFCLILFSIVETKIVHYSSFCYYGLSFFAAKQLSSGASIPVWMRRSLLALSVIWFILYSGIAIFGLSLNNLNPEQFIRDRFALANLEASISWSFFDLAPALAMLFGLLLFWFYKKQITLWLGALSSIYLFLVLIVPKIEGYSQRAAIDYFKSLKGEKAQVYTYAYKSYAHLFYSDKKPEQKQSMERYLVCKITKKEKLLSEFPNAQVLDSRNGFVLFRIQ